MEAGSAFFNMNYRRFSHSAIAIRNISIMPLNIQCYYLFMQIYLAHGLLNSGNSDRWLFTQVSCYGSGQRTYGCGEQTRTKLVILSILQMCCQQRTVYNTVLIYRLKGWARSTRSDIIASKCCLGARTSIQSTLSMVKGATLSGRTNLRNLRAAVAASLTGNLVTSQSIIVVPPRPPRFALPLMVRSQEQFRSS